MTTGIIHDQNLEKHIEKQVGCMAVFFQLFHRHQFLSDRGLHNTKRLHSAAAADSKHEISRELEKTQQIRATTKPSPDCLKSSPARNHRSPPEVPSTLPLPIFECKEGTKSSWKFGKETPRLSLDSRAIVDAKGKFRINPTILSSNRIDDTGNGVAAADGDNKPRSPGVIAKLMGLELLPNSCPEPTNNAELRRSASESRVSRDLFQNRLVESNNFQLKQPNEFQSVIRDNAVRENTVTATLNGRTSDPISPKPPKTSYRGLYTSPTKAQQRKSFDSADFFPEQKQTVSIYGDEIEKRLKMRGIDEPSNDLETLKQILEALQLKGLLHSKKASEQISPRNFVFERRFSSEESPIVIMKSSRSPVSHRKFVNDSPPSAFRNRVGVSRYLNISRENLPSMCLLKERYSIEARSRNSSSPTRKESNTNSPNSLPARRARSVETERKANKSSEQKRASPVHSSRPSPKRNGSDQTITAGLSSNRKSPSEIKQRRRIGSVVLMEDQTSSISESSVSTSSQTDTERLKMDGLKGGRGLLERCDKLLHSIMEMTATELHPSPVSVLDSSFYKDESLSPSPVLKRNIHFKDQSAEFEEEIWSPAISPLRLKHEDESDDCDFIYISYILQASNYLPEDTDIFLLLEKQQYLKGRDSSKESRLHRKLTFDTITEILDRNRQLPPWKLISQSIERPSLHQVWSEFQRIREQDSAEDLFGIICGVLRKDLAGDGINKWEDCPVEMSEAVLDIERLIFKDLVGETIRDLAAFAGNSRIAPLAPSRRKLFF